LLNCRESLQETLKCKENALKQYNLNGPGLNGDCGTNASGETIVMSTHFAQLIRKLLIIHFLPFSQSSSLREGRKQTVVKMNFEAPHHEELPDKSFQSSNESLAAVDEKISIKSSSVKSVVGSLKSTSALLDINNDVCGTSTQRKLKTAH
jgi:hypothetical protein